MAGEVAESSHTTFLVPQPALSISELELTRKRGHILIPSHKNANNVKDQATILSPKPSSPVEMLAKENHVDESLDTEFKEQ